MLGPYTFRDCRNVNSITLNENIRCKLVRYILDVRRHDLKHCAKPGLSVLPATRIQNVYNKMVEIHANFQIRPRVLSQLDSRTESTRSHSLYCDIITPGTHYAIYTNLKTVLLSRSIILCLYIYIRYTRTRYEIVCTWCPYRSKSEIIVRSLVRWRVRAQARFLFARADWYFRSVRPNKNDLRRPVHFLDLKARRKFDRLFNSKKLFFSPFSGWSRKSIFDILRHSFDSKI